MNGERSLIIARGGTTIFEEHFKNKIERFNLRLFVVMNGLPKWIGSITSNGALASLAKKASLVS